MAQVHHRKAIVDGHSLFYREAGAPDRPHVVLLHGYPTSSHMYRHLIPLLADRYHVVAPDFLGFGLSDAPQVADFNYSFDSLAGITAALLARLGIDRYAMYVQDYGAPVGWRLAIRNPRSVIALVSQNGNAYSEGFVDEYWEPIWSFARTPNAVNEETLRSAFTSDAIKWQYTHGAPDPSLVSPDTWNHDYALIRRPGMAEVQLELARDHLSNLELYPVLHDYFRSTQVPLLAVWGANDEIFGPAGAKAFAQDLPHSEIHLLNAGHFALETEIDNVAELVDSFLGRVLLDEVSGR
jgi:pimeloyl-ACP methyl ester carboxylesterase